MHKPDWEQTGRIAILAIFVIVLIIFVSSTNISRNQLKPMEGNVTVKAGGVEYGSGEFQLCSGKDQCVNVIQKIDSIITEMNNFETFLIILSTGIVAFEVIVVLRKSYLRLQ